MFSRARALHMARMSTGSNAERMEGLLVCVLYGTQENRFGCRLLCNFDLGADVRCWQDTTGRCLQALWSHRSRQMPRSAPSKSTPHSTIDSLLHYLKGFAAAQHYLLLTSAFAFAAASESDRYSSVASNMPANMPAVVVTAGISPTGGFSPVSQSFGSPLTPPFTRPRT